MIEALPELTPRLIQKIRSTLHLPVDQKQKVLKLLENQPYEVKLCHMDFHPDQILMTKNGPRVIDWETACQGNPVADVARTTLILTIGRIPRPTINSSRDLDQIRRSLVSAYLDQYFSHSTRGSGNAMLVWDLVAAITRLSEMIDGEESKLKQIIENKIEACGAV